MKPTLKPSGTKHLTLKCDIPLSNFAFKCNLRRYTVGIVKTRVEGSGGGRGGGARSVAAEATEAADNAEVGRQLERDAELDGTRTRDGGRGRDDENAMGERNISKVGRCRLAHQTNVESA